MAEANSGWKIDRGGNASSIAASSAMGGGGSYLSYFGLGVEKGSDLGAGIGSYLASRRQAKFLKHVGQEATRRRRLQTALLRGQQRAAYGASGVDVNYGSPIDVQIQSLGFGELEALDILTEFKNRAKDAKAQGTKALISGITSLIGGGSSSLGGMGVGGGS